MSLKQEIETWVKALEAYDGNEFEQALQSFSGIADTSKILFNCGVIHATLGEHDRAVDCYQRAISLDQYFAIAYFQEGVSNFLMGDFEEALANFNDTLLYLRGNTFIDYDQLGLKFKLYACEVLFNRGLCYIYLQQQEPGMADFQYAVKEKMTNDHDVIDDAIRERAQGYTVFSIPVGVLYRPNEAKVKNLKTKDYLGRARLVATANASNTSTGFQGADRARQNAESSLARDDRPTENISFAATNLVNRNISSRRDQSAPPSMGRSNAFPPTPPPEVDNKPLRSASIRNPSMAQLPRMNTFSQSNSAANTPGIGRAQTFDLDTNGSRPNNSNKGRSPINEFRSPNTASQPRLGNVRSASEQPLQRTLTDRSMGPSAAAGMDRATSVRGTPRQMYGEISTRSGSSVPEDDPFDVYSMYGSKSRQSQAPVQPQASPFKRGPKSAAPQYIDEEDEDEDIIIESDSADEAPSARLTVASPRAPAPRRGSSKAVGMNKLRIKVHSASTAEIRYIMIPVSSRAGVDYDDFESRVRAKFSLRGRLRMQVRDEECPEDMVGMSDQDDLDTLVATAKANAKRERSEMGKCEVWVQES